MLDLATKLAISFAEVASAVICFVLVWYMMKPYRLTGESRFLGLPLGFGILGISHVIATPVNFVNQTALFWFMLLFRTFSFLFIASTYLFSTRSSKKTQYLWNITFSSIIVGLFTLSLLVFIAPQLWQSVGSAQIYWRIVMLICLCYIICVTLRSHIKKPDPMTLWIPSGFIFLTLSQSVLIVYASVYKLIDNSMTLYWGAIVLRFAGFIMFLVVAYRTFYGSKELNNEADSAQG
jgi:hypothetical protein